MPETNDTATVEQETTEEKETEAAETKEETSDLSELKALVESQSNDIASLKRSLKKASKDTKETPTKTNDAELAEKVEHLSMQVAGITELDEVKLARDLQSETGLAMDKLLGSKYFKSELEDLRTAKANAEATSGVKGDKSGSGNAKQSADYWIAKGEYPTREQVSDRKVRQEIRKALVDKEKGTSGKFYNS